MYPLRVNYDPNSKLQPFWLMLHVQASWSYHGEAGFHNGRPNPSCSSKLAVERRILAIGSRVSAKSLSFQCEK